MNPSRIGMVHGGLGLVFAAAVAFTGYTAVGRSEPVKEVHVGELERAKPRICAIGQLGVQPGDTRVLLLKSIAQAPQTSLGYEWQVGNSPSSVSGEVVSWTADYSRFMGLSQRMSIARAAADMFMIAGLTGVRSGAQDISIACAKRKGNEPVDSLVEIGDCDSLVIAGRVIQRVTLDTRDLIDLGARREVSRLGSPSLVASRGRVLLLGHAEGLEPRESVHQASLVWYADLGPLEDLSALCSASEPKIRVEANGLALGCEPQVLSSGETILVAVSTAHTVPLGGPEASLRFYETMDGKSWKEVVEMRGCDGLSSRYAMAGDRDELFVASQLRTGKRETIVLRHFVDGKWSTLGQTTRDASATYDWSLPLMVYLEPGQPVSVAWYDEGNELQVIRSSEMITTGK